MFERTWRYVAIGTAGEVDREELYDLIATGLDSAVRTNEQELSPEARQQALANLGLTKWRLRAIGEFYWADTGETGVDIPPSDPSLGDGVWVDLTAGLTGSGQFNNGKLTSESVSGSAPLVMATAVVNSPGSPMHGRTIRLLNTERRMLRAGDAGLLQNDAFQGHRMAPLSPATSFLGIGAGGGGISSGSYGNAGTTGDPVTDGNNGTPRTANETRPKNIGVRIFRRIG